jgi:hypothetical protein
MEERSVLYLAMQPDALLTALIDDALTAALPWSDDPLLWSVMTPHAKADFRGHEIPRRALETLLCAHRSSSVFRMSHAYWMLLFDCLTARAAWHNANLEDTELARGGVPPSVGPARVGPIDLAQIVGGYFWDLWCFPDVALDHTFVPPPFTHRSRGGAERYAPASQGLVPIADPRWTAAPHDVDPLAWACPVIPPYPPRGVVAVPAAA